MAQREVVAGFVRCGVGDRLGPAAGEVPREHVGGMVGARGEHVEQGDPADARPVVRCGVPVRRRDHHTHPVGGVARRCAAQAVDAGVLGGDVDVERGVVVGDTLEDLVDAVAFGGRERGGVAVDVVGVVGERADREPAVPVLVLHLVAVEVEVDDLGGRRQRVQREDVGRGLPQRLDERRRSRRAHVGLVRRRLRRDRGHRGHRRRVRRGRCVAVAVVVVVVVEAVGRERVDVADHPVGAEEGGGVVEEQPGEFVGLSGRRCRRCRRGRVVALPRASGLLRRRWRSVHPSRQAAGRRRAVLPRREPG